MAAAVRRRAAEGAYDALTDEAFRDALNADLQAVSHDRHLGVRYHVEAKPPRDGDLWHDPAVVAEYFAQAEVDNYGVRRVERLAGGIGLLVITSIDEAEYAAPVIAGAMAVLASTRAMIIDVRANGGGAPSGVAFLCSYLFPPEPVHLNDIYTRPGDHTQQYWTLPHVPGERYVDKPVYVLTSGRTFSGAEEIAYNLQQLGRATVVGEQTGGGANPVDLYQLDAHFELRVPSGRAINPITATNWEGIGVTPDVRVDAADALQVAHLTALRTILNGLGESPTGAEAGLATEIRAALVELVDESR
jgi:C-terminal processing protease CtpA/Prc